MKRIICCLLTVAFAAAVSAQENPFKKSSSGDWAKYAVTTANETIPLMSTKDQPHWRVISNVSDEFVRCDDYILFGERRTSALGNLYYFKDRFEPVPGVGQTAKVKISSTSKEKLTVGGKQYNCTKVVRKVDQALDESQMVTGWSGTSTLWLCDQIPLGLAKMENVYQTKLTESDESQKIKETWVVTESGFKNWKDE